MSYPPPTHSMATAQFRLGLTVSLAQGLQQTILNQFFAALPPFTAALEQRREFSWRTRWAGLLRTARGLAKPTGLVVAFLGADGSGKTSVIERIQDDLLPIFERSHYYHLRPHFGRNVADTKEVTDPYNQTKRNSVASVGKLGFWLLDYSFSYATDIYWRLTKSTLVIFDRFIDDIIVDPIRYRYGGPESLARFAARMAPRPHLVILLSAPADVLQHRKRELTYAESERQARAYLDLVSKLANGHVVDASKPLEHVVVEVEKIILDHQASRTPGRPRTYPRCVR